MMESLADQLRNVPLEAAIEFAGQTVTMLYRPFAPEIAAFRAVPEQDRTRAMVDDLLERVLVSWIFGKLTAARDHSTTRRSRPSLAVFGPRCSHTCKFWISTSAPQLTVHPDVSGAAEAVSPHDWSGFVVGFSPHNGTKAKNPTSAIWRYS